MGGKRDSSFPFGIDIQGSSVIRWNSVQKSSAGPYRGRYRKSCLRELEEGLGLGLGEYFDFRLFRLR